MKADSVEYSTGSAFLMMIEAKQMIKANDVLNTLKIEKEQYFMLNNCSFSKTVK